MNRRKRLGEVLSKAGLINSEKLNQALAIQKQERKFLGRIFIERGWVAEKDVYQALAEILNVEYVDISGVIVSEQVLQLVPEELAKAHLIFPLSIQDRTLQLAMENPLQLEPIQLIEFKTQLRVKPMLASRSKIQDALNRHFSIDNYVERVLNHVKSPKEKIEVINDTDDQTEEDLGKLKKMTEENQITQLTNLLLVNAIKKRATDVHIEPGEGVVGIRYRVDGLLTDPIRIPKALQLPLVSRIKIMASLDIADRRRPQDGKIKINFSGRQIDLRVSTLPTNFGEKVVIRILDKKSTLHSLEELGMSVIQLALFQHAISQPQGLILVTGPTGSGKTTTLYAGLNALRDKTKNIVTIEDPIEYQLEGINQVQVNEKAGLTFPSTLRSILRQDPNVILVGEIRDVETAKIATQAAQTGHLVLSTLHTNDALGTVTRLFNLGVPPDQVASNLILAIAQRLVRRVCQQCKKSYAPSSEELKKFGFHSRSKILRSTFYKGTGCEQCKKTGYYGQVGLFEMLVPEDTLKAAITDKLGETTLKKLALEQGMNTLLQDGLHKVLQGITTLEEIARVCQIQEVLNLETQANQAAIERCADCEKELDPTWNLCPYCGLPKSPEFNRETSKPCKILVANDNSLMVESLQLLLEDNGYKVLQTLHGEKAISKMQEENLDFILFDVLPPGRNGFGAGRELQALEEIKAILRKFSHLT